MTPAVDCAAPSDRGYRAHLRSRERSCGACREAHNAYERTRSRTAPQAVRELSPCGTPAAWRRHKRHEEDACGACAEAHRVEVAAYARPRRRAA